MEFEDVLARIAVFCLEIYEKAPVNEAILRPINTSKGHLFGFKTVFRNEFVSGHLLEWRGGSEKVEHLIGFGPTNPHYLC